jgi:hypothetical protein
MLKMKGIVHENRKKGSKPLLGLPQTCAGGGTPFESEASGDVEEDEEEGEIIFPCALPLENLPLSGHLFGRQIGALARDR